MTRKCWTRSIGERGRGRIRLFEARPGGPLVRAIYINGREERKGLGHRDKERAVREGYALLAALDVNEQALEHRTLTVGMLVDLYIASPAHLSKKERTQRHDARALQRVVAFLGPTRNVASLSESDVQRFILTRRRGVGSLLGVEPGRQVRDNTIRSDLVAIFTALNWATRERTTEGQRLLKENPFFGIRLIREKNPRRPVMGHDVFLKLLEVAARIHPLLQLALIVAEGTGRRISAWRNLRWGDVDFEAGMIRWRAEHDKKGYEQVVPMSPEVNEALGTARRAQQAIGNTPVFPAPKNPAMPCDRHLFDNWLRRAYGLAAVPREPGGMWHAIRRKWASERKGYPVKDTAAAGGWRDTETLLTSYQQIDDATVKQIVLHPTHRILSRKTLK